MSSIFYIHAYKITFHRTTIINFIISPMRVIYCPYRDALFEIQKMLYKHVPYLPSFLLILYF